MSGSPSPDAAGAAGQEAIRIIGHADDDDWVIAPLEHAERYRETAPDLAAVLSSSRVRVVAEAYQDHDARALERQARFNTTSGRARAAVFWAGVASAFLLAGGGLSGVLPVPVRLSLITVAAAGAVIAGALGTMWIRQLKDGALLERWMTARARAETERLRYFEAVTGDAGSADPNLRLEYFRRYQLDVQRAFYKGRGAQHRQMADRALNRSSVALAGATVASGMAGVMGAIEPSWTALAAAALVAQAWAARVTNREATAQDGRNAERYQRTRATLDRLYERLDDVRGAVARGHPEVMREFVQAVDDQLSLEHRQWLEEMHDAGAAVGRLEALLSEYGEETGASTQSPGPP